MRKAFVLSVLAALCLAQSAKAIVVRVVEDSGERFAFDVVWGEGLPGPGEDVDEAVGPEHRVVAHDLFSFGLVSSDSRFGLNGFEIGFEWEEARGFADAEVLSFEGVQVLPLTGDPFGARFVYGEPYADGEAALDAATVPDGGSTLLLLSVGLGLGQFVPRRATRTTRSLGA